MASQRVTTASSCFADCTRDSDCATGVCYAGRGCTTDPCDWVQCATGSTCYQGSCYLDCTSSDQCDPGMFDAEGRATRK